VDYFSKDLLKKRCGEAEYLFYFYW